ncbi:MAG: hypothetical protein H6601_04115 [Flavobacteriales bacterium]|nr:hypothetical protein [Flavobacteriales bacterium]
MMGFLRVSILLMLFPTLMFGQQMVEYTKDFEFKDGLYITFLDFKNNNPIPLEYIVSDYDIRDADYLEQVLQNDSVVYYDNLYEERVIGVQQLWGFCQQGRVFIGFGAESTMNNPEFFDFYPLVSIGAISLFTAYETYYRTMSPGPNMGMGGIYDPMYNNSMTVMETEQVQLMLEFKTGRLLLANRGEMGYLPPELVAQILKDDPVLLEEFNALSGRDEKQKGMFFIRRFNERNPIYFPVSGSNY